MAIAISSREVSDRGPFKGYDVYSPNNPKFVGPGGGKLKTIGKFVIKHNKGLTKIGAGIVGAGFAGIGDLNAPESKFGEAHRSSNAKFHRGIQFGTFHNRRMRTRCRCRNRPYKSKARYYR